MAKINQVHTTDIIQTNEDGEVKCRQQTNATSYNLGQEPPFIKMYLDNILYIKDLPRKHSPVLFALLKLMPWANQNQCFGLTAYMKKQIAEQANCSEGNVSNVITDLVKGEVLIRVGTGTYQFNPHLFGRGEWKDIGELRLHVTFNAEGKTIMGEVIRKSRKPIIDENQLTLPLPNEEVNNEHTFRTNTTSSTNEPCRVSA